MDENIIQEYAKLLDKMCDAILQFDEIALTDYEQYVWRREWDLYYMPDPKEKDPLRYAIKACLVERMVEIWTSWPKNQTDIKAPEWCEHVGPVDKEFSVIPKDDMEFFKEEKPSPVFQKRNIFAPKEFMFFI